jgi:hypothetical protein
MARPSFGEILDLFVENSTSVRESEGDLINDYGQNYRNWCYKGVPNS